MKSIPIKGIETPVKDRSDYVDIKANSPWHKNWEGNYKNYKSSLESLNPLQENLLYTDVTAKNPVIKNYYTSATDFKKAALDNKVGMVHNSIIPTDLELVKFEKLIPREPDLLTMPPSTMELQKTPTVVSNTITPQKRTYIEPTKNRGTFGYSKLGRTSGGMSFIRGSNIVGTNKRGLVSTNKKWFENKIEKPFLQMFVK